MVPKRSSSIIALPSAALLAVASLIGCGVQRSTISRSDGLTPAAIQPAPDRAMLVFVGTDFRGGSAQRSPHYGARIIDDRGEVVGEVGAGNWIASFVSPGRRCWYAWHDAYIGAPDVAAICGTVVAGRKYFARVGSRAVGSVQTPTWAPGSLLDAQDPSLGLVLEPARARETADMFADRIARVRRDGDAEVAGGRFVALGEGFRTADGE